MATKSAASKGFRKQPQKKPYLTKNDIKILCICAVIALIVIIAFALYDDGALKVKDGSFVNAEDNWVIVNTKTSSNPRYFKLAEADALEGYELEPYGSTGIVKDLYYRPLDESNPVDYVSVSCIHSTVDSLSETVASSLEKMDGCVISELRDSKSGENAFKYYGYTYEYYRAPEGEEDLVLQEDEVPEPNTFMQSLNAYISAEKDSCITIHVVNEVESPEDYLPEDDLMVVLEQAVAAITLTEY